MAQETIKCPKCDYEIPVSEVLTHQIRENLKAEFEKELQKKEVEIRSKAEKVASEKLRLELEDLKGQISEKDRKLKEGQKAELELRRKTRELEEKKEALDLEIARKLDAEKEKIRQEALKKADEDHRLKDREKDKMIEDLKKSLDEAKRKIEQGSQQVQGEVFELELEDILKANFPLDLIESVPKGIKGADILQKVHNKLGQHCGTIILEVKRTKSWSDGWIGKLKDDQREVKAEIAVLMTAVLPSDVNNFTNINGVWVTNYASVIGLIMALRANLLQVAEVKMASVGKKDKMELVYNYLSSPEFKQKIEAIVESFVALKSDLEQEQRAMAKIWAKREKDITKVINSTAKMYGEMHSIIGASLPQIERLELKTLSEGKKEKETE